MSEMWQLCRFNCDTVYDKGQLGMAKLLVVEKKNEIQALLKRCFPADKISVNAVCVLDEALDKFGHGSYDVVIWDERVAGADKSKSSELLDVLSRDFPETQIIVVSTHEEEDSAYDRAETATHRRIPRPIDEDELCALVESALQKQSSVGEESLLHSPVFVPIEFEGILAISLPMRAVMEQIMEAASTDIPVLITGETGTGKDMVAAAIHKRSERKNKPYIPVNTGAMTPELIGSELFGHEKGAYTGASETRRGFFEQAEGGTVFLDEISTMDEKAQVSLLRILEEKTFRRVGGEKDVQVNVRVIAATNENLEEAVKEKRFREDLYYRLDVFRIHLPPLRDRPGAVTFLTDHYVSYFDAFYKKNVRSVPLETYRYLRRYPWPGNVRELKNVIQRAVLMAKGEELTPELLPARMLEAANAQPQTAGQRFPIQLGMTLEAVEKEFIRMTLDSTGGNKKEAARILGISRRALYNKLKRCRLL